MTEGSRRGIALGQIAGAILGVYGLRFGIALSPAGAVPAGVQLLAALYFLAALAGGILLLNRRPLGAWVSLLVQAAQVVAVTGAGGTLQFLAGPFLGIRAGGGEFRLELGVGGVAWATLLTGPFPWPPGAHFEVGVGLRPTDADATVIMLNALALVAAVRLFRHLAADDADVAGQPVRPAA